MVRIGDVWDSATDVLAGRAGVLAPIAALAFVLPAAVQGGVQAWGGGTTAATLAGGLIGIAGVVLSLWGHLATVAVASDPATTRAEAQRLGWRRLPAALLVALILAGLVVLLLLPAAVILVASGFDVTAASTAAQAGAVMPSIGPGAAGLLFLYALVLLGVGLWVSARLYVLYPVVLNEGLAAGAIGCSWRLTRGLTVQLIGVVLLFGIAWLVAVSAAQAVVGLVARLLLGADLASTAHFVGGLAGACVTAAWVVTVQVFTTRLYAALTANAPADGAAPRP